MAELQNGVTLSAPWYILRNQLLYTLGKTPGVTVGEIDVTTTPYVIRIDVKTCIVQAEAIRLVVPEQYTFGDIVVVITVYFNGTLVPVPNQAITTVEQVITIIKYAFWCNPLVKGIINVDGKLPPMSQSVIGSAVVVIEPTIIQFFSDNISNLCSNYIEVASVVFEEIFNLQYGTTPIKISFSPYDKKCMAGQCIISVCNCGC